VQGAQGLEATIIGGTTQKIWTTTTATEYTGITGYNGNNAQSYIVKLGGVVLTGGAGNAYIIDDHGTPNVGKIVLSTAPTAGYELEVRAIQVGSSAVPTVGTLVVPLMEVVNVGAAIGGTTHLDLRNQQVYLFDTAASANFTLNLRGTSTVALNSTLGTDNSISATVILREGSELKTLTAVTIDSGSAQTVQWQGNNSALTADKLNVVSLTVIKTAPNVYTVLGSITTVGA
jgi:hypothetical protein